MIRIHLFFPVLLASLPMLAQAEEMEIELMLIVEGDELRGISYSAASGPHVATVGITTDTGVATGAIASHDKVDTSHQEGAGFDLYASTVGHKSK